MLCVSTRCKLYMWKLNVKIRMEGSHVKQNCVTIVAEN
jgi:hypothetical protein